MERLRPWTGDVVVLNSGGPRMRVERVDGDLCVCSWTGGDGRTRRGRFPHETLTVVQRAELN